VEADGHAVTLEVQGNMQALLNDVQAHFPDRLTAEINRRWADAGAQRLREFVGGGPVTNYLTARSGRSRDSVQATFSAQGGTLSASGPGIPIQEDGGTIRPKAPNGWLTFRIHQPGDGARATGRWVRTRQVRIRPRHMVRDAAQQALGLVPAFLDFALETP
jgi:hypothetical protein